MASETFPTVKISAWNVTPPANGSMPTTTATDLAPRTVKMSTKRGRTFELDNDEVGTAEFEMRDDDAMWYGGDSFQPGQPVQVTASVDSNQYTIFTGYWDQLPWSQPSPFEGTAKVHAQDLLGVFSNRLLQSTITEYVLADSTCDAYFIRGNEVIGGTANTSPGGPSASQLAAPLGMQGPPWSGSFNGDYALEYDMNSKYSFGVPMSTPVVPGGIIKQGTNKKYAAIFGFSVNNTSDAIPLGVFLDYYANPILAAWYWSGNVYIRGYGSTTANANRDAWGSSSGQSKYVWQQPVSCATGDHTIMLGLDFSSSSTSWTVTAGVDGSNYQGTITADGTLLPWPASFALGSAINPGRGANASWYYSSISVGAPTSPTVYAWSTSGASLYGPAIWAGTIPTDTWGYAAYSEYGADTGNSYMEFGDLLVSAQTWSGGVPLGRFQEDYGAKLRRPHAYGSSLLNYLQLGATAVGARVFATAAGVIRVCGRGWLQLKPGDANVPLWNIGKGGYTYTGAPDFAYDLTRVASEVQVQAPDTTALYFPPGKRVLGPSYRSLSVSSQSADPMTEAQWLQSRYATAKPRPGQYTFNPAADSSLWAFCLVAELGDLVHVVHSAPGRPDLTFYGYIESIAHDVDAETGEWTTKMDISPRLGDYWILGDATYGVLDKTTVAGWGS